MDEPLSQTPLAQVWEMEELKRRYGVYDDRILLRWRQVLTGRHRLAIDELLRERGRLE